MSLKRNTLWSFLPLGTQTVLSLVSVPLFYRYLGPEMYALWFCVQALGSSFGFIDFGMGVSVGRYVAVALGKGDTAAAREYWGTGNAIAVPLLATMAVLFALVGAFLGPQWFNVSAQHIHLLRLSFMAAGVSLFLSYYLVFWNVLSQAHLDFKFISFVRVGATLLQIPPAILWARLTGNPLVLIGWSIVVAVVELAVFVVHAKLSYGIGLDLHARSMRRLKEMRAYTGKSFAAIMINSFFGSIDRLIAGKLAAPVDFANYNVAGNLGSRLSAFSYAAAAPVFSSTSRSAEEGNAAARIYNETFDFLIGWYVLAAVGAAVWSYPVAVLWLGPEVGAKVAPLLPPLVLGYCLSAISIISSTQLSALNRAGTQALFGLASGLFTIPCVYVGWKTSGIYGVAWGFLVSRLVLVSQDLFLIRTTAAAGWLSARTWLHILAQIALGCVFFLLLNLARPSPWLCLIFAAIHGGVVSLWLLKSARVKQTT